MPEMQKTLVNFYIVMRNLISSEEGQDLVEYALVVALIAFAATAGMSSLANQINLAFGAIANSLSSNVG
jgi:pilus assembly protein Flp/PilA